MAADDCIRPSDGNGFDAANWCLGTVPIAGRTADLSTSAEITSSPCFATGTLIATADGARTVETLVAGDYARLVDATLRRVVWIGHRRQEDGHVIRIRTHALGRRTVARPHRIGRPRHLSRWRPGPGRPAGQRRHDPVGTSRRRGVLARRA